MNLLASLTIAIVVTWLTRVMFITLVPADRLPPWARALLATAGPAVLGALTVATTMNMSALGTNLGHQVLPLGFAALLARRGLNLAVVVLGALGTATVVRALA